jgi:hypothetical protein
MRTASAECFSNQVDAEAMLRFTLFTLKQFVDMHGRREKLRQKLIERARRDSQSPVVDTRAAELAQLESRLADLRAECDTIEYRMARERDDNLYSALARQYEAVGAKLAAVEVAICQQKATTKMMDNADSPEKQAESALALLDDVLRITIDPAARAQINLLLIRLGFRVGLNFRPAIKGKKRVVQRLVSGRMVFGDNPLPVPLFGKDNVVDSPSGCSCPPPAVATKANDHDDEQERASSGKFTATTTIPNTIINQNRRETENNAGAGVVPAPAALPGDQPSPPRLNDSQPEGISITKVSRDDRTPIELCSRPSRVVWRKSRVTTYANVTINAFETCGQHS